MPNGIDQFDPALRQAIRNACEDIVNDPMSSDVVTLRTIMGYDAVREETSLSEDGLRSRIGRILTESEYAEKIARGKYRVTL